MSGSFPKITLKLFRVVVSVWLAATGSSIFAQDGGGGKGTEIRITELQGSAEVLPANETKWIPARAGETIHPFDQLRTEADSRAALSWSDQSVVPLGPSTQIEVLPPKSATAQSGLHLIRGVVSFFHRDKPGQIQVITRGAAAGVEGTEFVLRVDDADTTVLGVIDGKVRFGNSQATLLLTNGQQAAVELGKIPVRVTGFNANNLLQWCFYYPAVLDVDELPLTTEEQNSFASSLTAYRAGDLLDALAKFPDGQTGKSDAGQIYYAALLLSVGEVEKSEKELRMLSGHDERIERLADALVQVIDAVKREQHPLKFQPKLATEYLAASYYEQSQAIRDQSLKLALDAAMQAAAVAPQSGFTRERVAELEFSFGRTGKALDALNKSLTLAPRNPEAIALKGFLLAAQNHTRLAISFFDSALSIDSAFGNAWLGRGLCRIRMGDITGGREDLLVAAALEPQRAVLRSYLGKAYEETWDFSRATKEVERAEALDPNDPTAWLYSALFKQEQNQINDAIRDLEKSEELNDNRSVYRSQLLLDQDQAVRSASLATMYQDDGMQEISIDEASRAVSYDYGNYSAHLFLADSYEQLSDPNSINLRYETPAESEYLVANLLAPVGAGTLSPTISQGEYSKLFQRDGFGVVSDTEYLSHGAWTQSGAQFGTLGNSSYDFEALYHFDPGQWVNNDIQQRQLSLTVKQQITPQDTVYLNVQQYESDFGDLQQYYNPANVNTGFQATEEQNPNIALGYNHEWAPGIHTLLYATRLNDTVSFYNTNTPTLLAFSVPAHFNIDTPSMQENYENRLDIYSVELQQILEETEHTTIFGTRFQYGNFKTFDLEAPNNFFFYFTKTPAANQNINSIFRRLSFYGYHQWQILDSLQLMGGLDYDYLSFPEDFLSAPVSGNEKVEQQFSPKAGVVWTPLDNTTARFAYTRSLAGASVDQSYQIEPSQIAGFIQNYRSIIPESVVGAEPGAGFSTYDLSLEQKFHTGTYLTISGEILDSKVDRIDGSFMYDPVTTPIPVPSTINENLRYQEKTLQLTVNQLIGNDWSLGAKYRASEAILDDNFAGLPTPLPSGFVTQQTTKGTLNQVDLTAIYNHRSGFFAEGEALWYAQSNIGYTPDEPGDDFWQFNLFAGYRCPGRNIELAIGLLNIANQGYNLNPLNLYNELPLRRTLAAQLQFNF